MKKGLTQTKIGPRPGLSQQYLSDLERGKRNPTVVILYEIAQAIGVTVSDPIAENATKGDSANPQGK